MNEIEMNFVVKDKNGLLTHLRTLATETTSEITMTYLGKSGDKNFYIRIEEIKDANGERKFLTGKGNFKSVDGINQRKEITLAITENPKKYVEFLQLIRMELRDSKSKVRHLFKIDGLEVTLDEWNVAELGDRLEIEGESADKVKDFSNTIMQYCDPTPSA
jgi:adenylate cyclase class IV